MIRWIAMEQLLRLTRASTIRILAGQPVITNYELLLEKKQLITALQQIPVSF